MSARNIKSNRKKQRKLNRKIAIRIKLKADQRNAMEARAFFFCGESSELPKKGDPLHFLVICIKMKPIRSLATQLS